MTIYYLNILPKSEIKFKVYCSLFLFDSRQKEKWCQGHCIIILRRRDETGINVGWVFNPTMKLCWGRNPNLQKAISSTSRKATRHVKWDLVPAFTLAEVFSPYYLSPRRIAFTLAEVFLPSSPSPRKVAFTLAEVLITLGIIGVVAAMTLPTLINNYQAKETVTRLKKVYSIVNQAYLQAQNDLGTIDNWGISNSSHVVDPDTGEINNSEETVKSMNLFWSTFESYLKTLKRCLDYENQCKPYAVSQLGSNSISTMREPKLILNDGAIFSGGWIDNINCNKNEICGNFSVDLNGLNRPNIVGRDIFYFYIYKNKILPMGQTDDTKYSFDNYCLANTAKNYNGYGCTAWVIYNENMDYLKCDDLSWSGKHKCK